MEKASAGPRPPSPASLRWGILRRSFLFRPCGAGHSSQTSIKTISRKTAGGFNLISSYPVDDPLAESLGVSQKLKDLAGPCDVCVCYKLPMASSSQLILIKRMEDCIDRNDFEISARYDIDTTGLVCCWPSEDVLAYFCISHSNMFRSKRVLELGSGYGLAGLAIAASTDACEVVISDGNPRVVDYIQRNISVNAGIFGDTKVKSLTLHWNQEQASDVLNAFDIIVASDCTFFKESHESLAHLVKSLLKHSGASEAIFVSPKRGDSLDKFIERINSKGLHFELVENYDSKVWNLHQEFLKGNDSSWPNYDRDHCYPLLTRVTFSTPGHPYHHQTL